MKIIRKNKLKLNIFKCIIKRNLKAVIKQFIVTMNL